MSVQKVAIWTEIVALIWPNSYLGDFLSGLPRISATSDVLDDKCV